MLEKSKKVLNSNNGFTILELIVVIAIMGFLIAIVAPKLVGVTEKSQDPACENNEKGLEQAIDRMIEENEKFPNKLRSISPVITDGNVSLGLPIVSINYEPTDNKNKFMWDGVKSNKAEFSKEFVEKNNLYMHRLSNEEANEIKNRFGIKELIEYPKDGTTGRGYKEDILAYTSKSLLMIGSGATSSTGKINGAGILNSKVNDPNLSYRLVLGIGTESDLVKEGLISTIGKCPLSSQHKKNVEYEEYSIVLPRLKATVDRLSSTAPAKVKAKGYDNDMASGNHIIEKTFDIGKEQKNSDFQIICPEGHKIPITKEKIWKITEKVAP